MALRNEMRRHTRALSGKKQQEQVSDLEVGGNPHDCHGTKTITRKKSLVLYMLSLNVCKALSGHLQEVRHPGHSTQETYLGW